LSFGYGFLVLIAVAAYTANLAAFLTVAGVSNYIETMNDAISRHVVMCAPLVLAMDLKQKWPDAIFVFYTEMEVPLQMFDKDECGAIVAS
jgi:hypothetical protein